MKRRTAFAIVVSAALMAISSVHAQARVALLPPAAELVPQASAAVRPDALAGSLQANPEAPLKPGEFLWLGDATGPGSLVVLVSLAEQRATVYRNGQVVAVSTVSTGMPGRETPTGVYPILQKEKMHHSNLYNDAAMPFMQRLTWDGVALHAGRIPGHPASHGCVRLPRQFAQQLFSVTERGQTVIISDDGSIDALLRVGVPELLAAQIGRTGDLSAAEQAPDAASDGTGIGVDADSVSYQEHGTSIGGGAH